MKKTVSLLLCAVLLVGLLAFSAMAADVNRIIITADKAEALPGEEVVFTITMESTQPIDLFGLILEFDRDVFEFVKGKCTASYLTEDEDDLVGTKNFSKVPGKEGLAVSFLEPVVYNGQLGEFTLRVKEAVDFSKVEISAITNAMNGYDELTTDVIPAEVAKHEHAWVSHEAVAPGCVTEGNIAYRQCSGCGLAETLGEIPEVLEQGAWIIAANGHAYVDHAAQAPDCVNIGWNAYQTCENCDYTSYVEIPANGHAYVNHEAQAPTCDAIGWNAYQTCENCAYTSYEELSATGHDWVDYEAVDPTCELDGNIAYQQCATCGAAQTAGENPMPLGRYGWVLSATGHDWVDHEAVAPTCETEGNIAYQQCATCGAAQTAGENPMPLGRYGWVLSATGHDWVDYEAVDPTCEFDGNIAYQQCATCGAAQTAGENPMPLGRYGWVLSATGHDWVDYEAVDPTCEFDGNIAYQQCATCGAAQTAGENPVPLGRYGWVVAATGHDWVDHEAVAPTCETEGNIAYQQCATCGAAQTAGENPMPLGRYGWVVSATGHDYHHGFCTVCQAMDPEYIFGDINGDGKITNDDVVMLMWNALFPDVYPVDAYTDMNCDGQITNDDVIKLMWYALFPDVYPLEIKPPKA